MAERKGGFSRIRAAAGFLGVNQSVGGRYLKPGESPQALNARTDKGVLSTAAGYVQHIGVPLPAPPVAPMLFHQYGEGGTVAKRLLVSTADDLYHWTGSGWVSVKGAETIGGGDFSYANYVEAGVSKIILSNGIDPVYEWTGSGTIGRLFYDAGPPVAEAPRAKCVTIHAERLWAGGVAGSPNTVFASDAYAPSEWTAGPDGAGYITVSTWDGGSVAGLASLLGDVAVFKQGSIFRIVGTYPGEFQPVQVLTMEGTVAPRSLCQYDNRAYFVSDDGIMVYDTAKAAALLPGTLRDFWAGVNLQALGSACGIAHNGKLRMAVPWGAGQTANNRVVEYDLRAGTVQIRAAAVTRFLEDDEDLLFTGPGNYVYRYGAGTDDDGAPIAMSWETPRTDWGSPSRKYVYGALLTGYSDGGDGGVELTLSTDETTRTAQAVLPAVPGIVRAPLRGSGRVMSLGIANVEGSAVHVEALDVELDVMEDL